MNYIFNNSNMYVKEMVEKLSFSIVDGVFSSKVLSSAVAEFDFSKYTIFPGFSDVHVHFREPGFSYKETILTGSNAAAHGGYTTVCTMPNLNPCPDTLSNLNKQLEIIEKDSKINIIPYGTITMGEKGESLSEMDSMSSYVVAFSDDGRGVQNNDMMRQAMIKAKELGKLIVAHCEDNSLLNGGYIHQGEYCLEHNHKGICSESEWKQIERDLVLVKDTKCGYHVCHISTKESVELIRQAKKDGLNVSCETGPHYLVMNDSQLQESGNFKMNPPIRSKADQDALIEGIIDGTIEIIATDHAPHSAEEKSKGLKDSLMGIVGLETAFPLLYTNLVKTNVISLEKLIELMHYNPCKRFEINNELKEGLPANFTVYDLNANYDINPDEFLSKGRNTPFAGWNVYGKCMMTVCNGRIAYIDSNLK